MRTIEKLYWVKFVHTVIWVFFNLVLAYMAYAVLTGQIDFKFWIGVGLIALEAVVLLLNRWSCPLTHIARRYSDSRKDNFDIFLPEWIARHNKSIYTTIFVVILILFFISR